MRAFIKAKIAMIIVKRTKPVHKMNLLERFLHIVEYPFVKILLITALPVSDHHYSKMRCVIYPIPGFIFIWFVFLKEINLTYLYIPLPIGILTSVIFYFVLDPKKPPKWSIAFTIMGVISGLMWTYMLIGTLIDMLDVFGLIFNLEKTYLGLTILAVGNALPDALTTFALIKSGAGNMAISGSYAGQLFGYLVGFGISMLKKNINKGPQKFDLFDKTKLEDNFLDILVLAFAVIALLSTFLTGLICNFRMNKIIGSFLLILYLSFIGISTAFAVFRAISTA